MRVINEEGIIFDLCSKEVQAELLHADSMTHKIYSHVMGKWNLYNYG